MTHAVLMVLIFLAILFVFHAIFLLILLKSKSKRSPNQANDQIMIVYASQSGQVESYAMQTAQQLSASGQSVQTLSIDEFHVDAFKSHSKILWMVSTYGAGDAPDTARRFIQNVMTKSFELNDIQYAVLAFGDRHYANFNAFGQRLDLWLTDNHAQALFPMVCVDHLSQTDLSEWQTQLNSVLQMNYALPMDNALQNSPQLDIGIEQQSFYPVVLSERYLLNQGSLGNPMYYLVLTEVEALHWQSGDILEIQCANTITQMNEFISHLDLQNQSALEKLNLLKDLKFKNLRSFDPTQDFAEWLNEAKDLPIREYSIASIPSQQQLELVVRQEVLENGLGLGSGYLTESLAFCDALNCRIRSNPAFHLRENHHGKSQPIILIGNGSGIAGLMSHLRQREESGLKQNWLIYGERQRAVDFAFEKQFKQWQESGVLTEVDLAFSRDQNPEKYVQDCLFAKSEQIKTWIEQGATIYICGSLQGMAEGVQTAFIQILGQTQFEQLIEQKRYLRDVY